MSDTHDQQERAAEALDTYLHELHGIWRIAPTRQTAFNAARVVLDAVCPRGGQWIICRDCSEAWHSDNTDAECDCDPTYRFDVWEAPADPEAQP